MPDKVITTANPCGCCGGTPPVECECALLIPPTTPFDPGIPYADYATALAVVDGSATLERAECYGYLRIPSGAITSFSADASVANELTLAAVTNQSLLEMFASVSMKAGSVPSVDYAFSGLGSTPPQVLYCELRSCDGTTTIEYFYIEYTGSGTLTFAALAADGEYQIYIYALSGHIANCALTATITSDDATVPNPVIALWDDSGTTRRLEACPKLYLPFLTESTGDWYADCAAAADVMSYYTADCLVFCPIPNAGGGGPRTALAGSFDGTTFAISGAAGSVPSLPLRASLNLLAGSSLAIVYSVAGALGVVGVDVTLYDETGAVIAAATGSGASGTVTLGAATPGAPPDWPPWGFMPYSGRYILEVVANAVPGGGMDVTGSFSITSSAAFSPNPPQALYDTGLTCPARLDCGNSCP